MNKEFTNETMTTTAVEGTERTAEINSDNIKTAEAKTPGVYVHKLKTPFTWEGVTYTEFKMDFNKLTGADLSAVEQEMLAEGRIATSPEFSLDYALKIAAKATGVHSIVFVRLPLYDANAIRREVKSFLMNGD